MSTKKSSWISPSRSVNMKYPIPSSPPNEENGYHFVSLSPPARGFRIELPPSPPSSRFHLKRPVFEESESKVTKGIFPDIPARIPLQLFTSDMKPLFPESKDDLKIKRLEVKNKTLQSEIDEKNLKILQLDQTISRMKKTNEIKKVMISNVIEKFKKLKQTAVRALVEISNSEDEIEEFSDSDSDSDSDDTEDESDEDICKCKVKRTRVN
jgi:hypothetical protein